MFFTTTLKHFITVRCKIMYRTIFYSFFLYAIMSCMFGAGTVHEHTILFQGCCQVEGMDKTFLSKYSIIQ